MPITAKAQRRGTDQINCRRAGGVEREGWFLWELRDEEVDDKGDVQALAVGGNNGVVRALAARRRRRLFVSCLLVSEPEASGMAGSLAAGEIWFSAVVVRSA
jgi:hypothetical protein